MRTAREVGLPTLRTLWTNDRAAVAELIEVDAPSLVVKSVATAYWEADGAPHFVFANRTDAADLPTSTKLAAAPLCFQEAIAPKDDIRVTVIGSRCFSAVRDTATDDPVDWRLGDQTPWQPIVIPADVGDRCTELVSRLGLRFGGIDLVRDADGAFWFIEINPNGEWGWLEASGLPIAAAITDELTAGE